MEKGHNYENRIRNAKRFGPIPEHLHKPVLRADVAWVYAEYEKLGTCRSYAAGGPAYIPYLAVMEFAAMHRYSRDTAEEFWYMIHAMDIAMLDHFAKRIQNG